MFAFFTGTVANRDTQHCFETGGEGARSAMTHSLYWSATYVRRAAGRSSLQGGGELLVVRAAESATASGGEAAETLQPGHPCKTYMPSSGITDRSCVTSAHGTLPWGSHYRNLVAASGHARVAFALEHDPQVMPQVREAATRAPQAAAVQFETMMAVTPMAAFRC